jgi:general secretion pathway protein A
MLERRLIRKKEEKESSPLCFKCKAKLPPNADVCPYCGAQVGLRMWHTISEEQRTWYAGLSWIKNPFSLDCHPELFTGYKKEVKEILEKVNVKSGHVLITGPLGMGKTTMLRWMSAYLPKKRNPIYIARPPQHFSELLRYIVQTLHFPPGEMQEYNIYNLDKLRKKMGGELVLLLDEAHEFTIDIERPLRTLGDLDDVTLVMAGLPETIDKFKKEIQPLYDRLVLVVNLTSMEFESFRELIKTRIEDAGGQGIHPFSLAALEKIYAISKGNPRMALKLCDAAVTRAMNKGEDRIGEEIVQTDEFAAMKIQ